MNQTLPRKSGGYPLVALFLVISACGIVAALLGPAARAMSEGRIGLQTAVYSVFLGMLAVMLVGGVVGLFHYRRLRGLVWGLITGAVLGMFAGPLVLAPRESFGAVVSLSFGGAVVIVLISLAFCIASRK
jgi:F0F1-type ATP synthase assembly protein I